MLELVPRPPAVASVAAVVAGIVLLAIGEDFSATEVAGFILLGLGGIGLVALAFYAVGRSEDLDRERRPGG